MECLSDRFYQQLLVSVISIILSASIIEILQTPISKRCRSFPQNQSSLPSSAAKIVTCTPNSDTPKLNSQQKQHKAVQAQIRRNLPDALIKIQKNINIKPRLNAFQIKYRKLLVFSKLSYGKFGNSQDLVNVLLGISHRNRYQIEKIILQLGNQDLYTYLKSKSDTVKISYKFIMGQINKILENNVQKLKLTAHQMNNPTQITNIQILPKNRRPKTSRIMTGKYKQSIIKKEQQTPHEYKSKTSKQFDKENIEEIRISPRDSKFKSRRKTSRYSIMESRGAKNTIKLSWNKKDQPEKYMYLSKDMDVECEQREGEQENFEILDLSEDEENQQDNLFIDEQKLMQRKIEQGLNFKLTANYSERKYSRKYSSEYQKFAELLEQELKEDELKLQKQCSKFQEEAAKSSQVQKKCNESSGTEENQLPSVFEIDQMELESKRDLWNDEIQISKKDQADLIEEEKFMRKEKQNQEPQIFMSKTNSQKIVLPEKSPEKHSISIKKLQPNDEFKQESNNQQINDVMVQDVKKNYEANFNFQKIHGNVNQILQRQISLHLENISSILELSHVILYLHKLNPSNFPQLLHISDLTQIRLSVQATENKITLFNPAIGMFETYNLKIKLSKSSSNQIPDWILVVCQGVFQILQKSQHEIYQILRILTGAPIVKLNAVDLRRIKRVIVQNIFQNKNQRKGKVLCSRQIQPNNQLEFCQLVQFEKDKDFLQSKVTYIKFLSACNQTYETTTKVYEQFVLNYQNIMLCFFKNNYYHNQQQCIFNQIMNQNDREQSFWGIQIELTHQTEVFLQFNQHEKRQKPNQILISKVAHQNNQEQNQPIGQLNKKGNFFFELSLESGVYLIQITRSFDPEQVNSVHFFSSNPINIRNSQILSK